MTLDPTRASMLGKLGQARRWAKTVTPDDRRQATQPARDAQKARYVVRAREMEGGDTLTEGQLEERASQLRLADLAAMRLRRWDNQRRRVA